MKRLRIKFEYGCFPVWIYTDGRQLIDNDLPAEWIGDAELDPVFTHLQETFDALYVNDGKEFNYIGFTDKEQLETFRKELAEAVLLLNSKLGSEYDIEIPIFNG